MEPNIRLTRSLNEHYWNAAIQKMHDNAHLQYTIASLHHSKMYTVDRKIKVVGLWLFFIHRSHEKFERVTAYIPRPTMDENNIDFNETEYSNMDNLVSLALDHIIAKDVVAF